MRGHLLTILFVRCFSFFVYAFYFYSKIFCLSTYLAHWMVVVVAIALMALGQHTQRQSWRTCSRNTIDRNMINSRTYFKPWEKSVQFHEMETNIALENNTTSESERWVADTYDQYDHSTHIHSNPFTNILRRTMCHNAFQKDAQWTHTWRTKPNEMKIRCKRIHK